ncbi:MAG: helix-turn-helix domain-containing protein [bacterium]
MPSRKVFCEIVEGVVYDDRCLFSLSKIIEGNKTCEDCIVRVMERVKSRGIKGAKARPGKKAEAGTRKRPNKIRTIAGDTEKTYSVKSMAELLGKSKRRIQELAKEGKIPARKVGPCWHFDKDKIDRWFSEKGLQGEIVDTTCTRSAEEGGPPPEQNSQGSPERGEV